MCLFTENSSPTYYINSNAVFTHDGIHLKHNEPPPQSLIEFCIHRTGSPISTNLTTVFDVALYMANFSYITPYTNQNTPIFSNSQHREQNTPLHDTSRDFQDDGYFSCGSNEWVNIDEEDNH